MTAPKQYIFDALILHPIEPKVLLRGRGSSWALPRFEPEDEPTFFGGEHFNRPLKRLLGLEVVSLDCVHRALDSGAQTWHVSMAFESRGHHLKPPPGHQWVNAEGLAEGLKAPADQTDAAYTWLAEIEGGRYPPERVPWALPGWHAKACHWIEEQMAGAGTGPGEIEQVQVWAGSCVLCARSEAGKTFFKAVPGFFASESAKTHWLSVHFPDDVPRLQSADYSAGWTLMSDFGGVELSRQPLCDWERAIGEYARLQVAAVGHTGAMTGAGFPTRSLADLRTQTMRLLTDPAILAEVDRDQSTELQASIERIERACDTLMSFRLPDSIVHGDLHAGNIHATDGRPVFFDWTDSCVGHPFMDMAPLFHLRKLPEGDGATDAIRDAYLNEWSAFGTPDQLRAAFEVALLIGCVFQLASYEYILKHTEPGRHWQINGYGFWLRQLLALTPTLP